MMLRDRSSTVAGRLARKSRLSQVRLLEGLESRILMTTTYVGAIESANAGQVIGYAYDPNSPNTSILLASDPGYVPGTPTLALEINNNPNDIRTIDAITARPDLTFPTSYNQHGISSSPPSEGAGTYTISLVEFSGDTSSAPTILAVLDTKTFTNQAPVGVIQTANSTTISGYAYDPDQPSTSLFTLLEIDGVPTGATQTANMDQPALTATIGSSAHGFSYTLPTLSAGTHTVQVFAQDAVGNFTTQIGSTFTVGGASNGTVSSILSFATEPTTANVNATLAPVVVALKTPSGNLVTGDSSTVTLTIASGPTGATIGGTVTGTLSNGLATFSNLAFSTPGSYILTATDAADGLTATSTAFTVNQTVVVAPAPDPTSTKLLIKGQPTKATTTSSLTGPITVQVVNKKNKIVTTDESAVTLSILKGPAGGTLSGTITVAAVNGVATFNNVILSGGGKYTLQATDAGLAVGKGKNITVAALPAASLVITTQPINVAANAAMATPIAIELLDRNGNLATATKGSVKLAATLPAGAKLAGNSATIKNGVASFPKLKIKTAGTYVLTVSAAGLTATTTTFIVA